MDHSDSRLDGILGRVEADFLSIDEDLTAITAGIPDLVHSKEDLHQSALTGSVLSDKAKYLARVELEVDVVENLVA